MEHYLGTLMCNVDFPGVNPASYNTAVVYDSDLILENHHLCTCAVGEMGREVDAGDLIVRRLVE